MSSWTCVTFETADRPLEAVEADLEAAVDDPTTFERDGDLVWRRSAPEPLDGLAVDVQRALDVWMNDTTMTASGHLYERVDGRFVETDVLVEPDGFHGRRVVEYFEAEHGIAGTRDV